MTDRGLPLLVLLVGVAACGASDDSPAVSGANGGAAGAVGASGAAGKGAAAGGGASGGGGGGTAKGGAQAAGASGSSAAGGAVAGTGGAGGGAAGGPAAGAAGGSGGGGGIASGGKAGGGGTPQGGAGGKAGGSGTVQGGAGGAATGGAGMGGTTQLPTTALEQIRSFAAPVFKQAHTLPPLTYASCTWSNPKDVEFETEMVEKYGYAYSLHRAEKFWNDQLTNPASDMAKKVQKNKSDPQRYKLFTTVIRPLWSGEEGRATPYATYLQTELPSRCGACSPSLLTADSTVPGAVRFSPAADPHFYDVVGDDVATALAPYKAGNIPLAVVLNLAEDGIGLSQGDCFNHHWDTDPAIVADLKAVLGVTTVPACNTKAWADYASKRSARAQQRITDKVMASLPAGALYLRYRTEGNLNRERYGSWYDYAPFYEDTKLNSSLPNMSAYYAGDEPPFLHWGDSAWDANTDMLTGTLSSIAWQIKAGSPSSYNWLSGGWPTGTHTEVSPIDRYTGYLKALYVAGGLGGVATWWSPGLWQTSAGKWSCDPTATLANPGQVQDGIAQIVALGEVHALFSHYEDFLRNGTLLPGPGVHRFTANQSAAKQVPAYELVCKTTSGSGAKTCDRALRVLARKHATKSEWIVVAFAATGADQTVGVDLPGAGSIDVSCRAAGSLYHVTLNGGVPVATLVDADPFHPTAQLTP